MEFAGDVESHYTISENAADRIPLLHAFAARHNLKVLLVVLDRGVSPTQPMLTRQSHGMLSGELAAAQTLTDRLRQGGFAVTRVKIEAAPWNTDVPASDEDAHAQPADRYWEHHVKLLLPPDAATTTLAETAQRHQAHVSCNALKTRADGQQERFVTQRCRRIGRDSAQKRLDALIAALAPFGFPVLEEEQEFVIYDSNLALDNGWIPEETT